jgi:hypothetical protein
MTAAHMLVTTLARLVLVFIVLLIVGTVVTEALNE